MGRIDMRAHRTSNALGSVSDFYEFIINLHTNERRESSEKYVCSDQRSQVNCALDDRSSVFIGEHRAWQENAIVPTTTTMTMTATTALMNGYVDCRVDYV